eukprot:CAMPEP_0119399408 /NCGR_PEP_ID=MMETSP1334-20130426/141346_1 /TAXON_ID=127549 /ORGANISM="Calcidiscus leptoporus, Strain RCC1130" /LENGTH=122 /DNA_ID=CAMNT_0007423301 /DNA_START=509 /DNA_END=877 /DNA_ORIENTATION=-
MTAITRRSLLAFRTPRSFLLLLSLLHAGAALIPAGSPRGPGPRASVHNSEAFSLGNDIKGPFFERNDEAGAWWACDAPTNDPMTVCFLAPDWMGLPANKWVCSDQLIAPGKAVPESYPEDSY